MKKPIDENMVIKAVEVTDDLCFYDVRKAPFSLHGVWYDTDSFYRIPREVSRAVSKNVYDMCDMTAGGRVRFSTNSRKIVLKANLRNIEVGTVLTPLALKGFDLYADGVFTGIFNPPYTLTEGELISSVSLGSDKTRQITINLPLYAAVTELYIGIEKGATLAPHTPYNYETPVVFYGSSITNGAAASRPGMTYESLLSRRLDMDYHNLGFGGSAKGEDEMAEYIASLNMSVFVYDYDYNAPSVEHLEKTHERFFKIFRKAHPKTPVIMISNPSFPITAEREKRYEVIKATYDRAVAVGDENVYLLRGSDMFDGLSADYTVDGIHLTDLGFFYMANRIYPVLKEALEKTK